MKYDWIKSPSSDLDETLARIEQKEKQQQQRQTVDSQAYAAISNAPVVRICLPGSPLTKRKLKETTRAGGEDVGARKRRAMLSATSSSSSSGQSQSESRPRRGRLMSLSQMCFKTILAHLPDLAEEDVGEITTSALPLLGPRFADPLRAACASHLDHLERLQRAKKAALAARDKEQRQRPSSVALVQDDSLPTSSSMRFAMRKPKVEKSKGGQKIWRKARMAAGSASSALSNASVNRSLPFCSIASRSSSSLSSTKTTVTASSFPRLTAQRPNSMRAASSMGLNSTTAVRSIDQAAAGATNTFITRAGVARR